MLPVHVYDGGSVRRFDHPEVSNKLFSNEYERQHS
jgi:hypothetical protein